MNLREKLRHARIGLGCWLSGRSYDREDIQWHLDSVDRLRKEASYHPLGCEIDGCDRIATDVLSSASDTDYQVCRPCSNALKRGFADDAGPTSATGIDQPWWLVTLSDKTVPPPSEREAWD